MRGNITKPIRSDPRKQLAADGVRELIIVAHDTTYPAWTSTAVRDWPS